MLGVRRTIEEGDNSKREKRMNKLSEDNEPVHSEAAHVHPDRRINRLKDGEFFERNSGEDDDNDQKSLTLESLRDRSKSLHESQRDGDFVSESSLTIVSDSDLFQENSRWWSMIENSHSNNSNGANPNSISNVSTSARHGSPNTSINNACHQNINNGNTTCTTVANSNINNSSINNTSNTNNHLYNARSPTRRRSSLLSDITFESDEHIADDIDAHTTDSTDSSWASNSALLATARRFSPNYYSGGNSNETIEEEHYDYHEQLKQSRDTSKASSATTAAPVIPRRRVSATYKGPHRISATSTHSLRTASDIDEFDTMPSKMTHYNHVALRAMARGNAAAPTIPQRTSSHSSKMPGVKKNSMIYHMYNTSHSSIAASLISQDTDPSFFEDGSAAAAAAAAYLSSAATASQQEEVRTVHTDITSDTIDTPVLTNSADGNVSREEPATESETPPILPERRESVPLSLTQFSSFEEEEEEAPSILHEERSQDGNSAKLLKSTKPSNQPPSIPLRKHSNSRRKYSSSPRCSGNRKSIHHPQSRFDTQPPTCPLRKDSNHLPRRTPISSTMSSHRNPKFVPRDPSLSQHQLHQPSHKHKPPTKPMRTNSNSISRSPTSATSG